VLSGRSPAYLGVGPEGFLRSMLLNTAIILSAALVLIGNLMLAKRKISIRGWKDVVRTVESRKWFGISFFGALLFVMFSVLSLVLGDQYR
jgi:hypothetical protein